VLDVSQLEKGQYDLDVAVQRGTQPAVRGRSIFAMN
jgi:hypothetical protein